ncbi:hypothetical protein BJX66DRAFT_320873, partial [Aspergillus keveii]
MHGLPTGIAMVARLLLLLPGVAIPTLLPLISINDPVQILVQNHPPAPSSSHVSVHQLRLLLIILSSAALYTTGALHPMRLDDDGLAGLPVPPGPAALLRV